MDSGESMTFTVLILLLLIIIVMFACHYLGPRATTWMRSNREEKIGLSKNKLFHSNGYMLSSGSTFLLSNSGSFKRFDITEKEEAPKATEKLSTTTATTPFWNLPQQEVQIPPQPLRPAPEPGKTVTFKLNKVDEIEQRSNNEGGSEELFVPFTNSTTKSIISFQAIKLEAPPPPRLFTSMAATNASTAIPRPMARRYFSQDKFHDERQQQQQLQQHNRPHQPLTRRNSSTNPFLCDTIDNITLEANNEIQTALDSSVEASNRTREAATNLNSSTKAARESNPFLAEAIQNDSSPNDHNFPTLLEKRETDTTKFMNSSKNHFEASNFLKHITNPSTTIKQEYRFRGRLLSETGWSSKTSPNDIKSPTCTEVKTPEQQGDTKLNPFASLAQKAKGPHMLQKTFSEDFLFRKINSINTQPNNTNGENGTWSFGRSLLRQNSLLSLARRNSSQGSLDSTGSVEELERAISCDSVNSDSVFLCDLDQTYTQITGHLCVGLHYDNLSNEGFDLIVTVNEAKGLISPFSVESLDTFVRIYLVPDAPGAMQTQVIENSQAPHYNESFNFWLKKQNGRHSLWFHVYHNGESHTLIGEAEMEIHEAPRTITTWIPLSDSRKRNAQWGELMFSLSYLPTAERLTIVVVKARNLKLEVDSQLKSELEASQGQAEIQSVFIKVYLMNNERKMLKKRTSLKRRDRSIIFNESMIFSVPPQGLTTVQLRLTVYGLINSTTIVPLGHVIAGSCATGKGLRHWHQMLSSLRKPVSMWHVLRRAINQPVFTGGAEAVVAALQSTSLRSKRNSVI